MNELITLEINSKNKLKLIDLLNESNLVVEILNDTMTFSVVRPDGTVNVDISSIEDERIDPQPRVLKAKSEQGLALKGFNYNISETT